jgi:hypothetical protein
MNDMPTDGADLHAFLNDAERDALARAGEFLPNAAH